MKLFLEKYTADTPSPATKGLHTLKHTHTHTHIHAHTHNNFSQFAISTTLVYRCGQVNQTEMWVVLLPENLISALHLFVYLLFLLALFAQFKMTLTLKEGSKIVR